MQTLNQLKRGLNDIADAHLQIRSFGFGDLHEFGTSGTTEYVSMWVDPQPVLKNRRYTQYRMTIYLFDRVLKGEANETEVLSDLIRIAEDIIAEIRHPSWTWNQRLADEIQIEYDTERMGDWLGAAWFNIEFRLPTPDNRCQIPENSITRF